MHKYYDKYLKRKLEFHKNFNLFKFRKIDMHALKFKKIIILILKNYEIITTEACTTFRRNFFFKINSNFSKLKISKYSL